MPDSYSSSTVSHAGRYALHGRTLSRRHSPIRRRDRTHEEPGEDIQLTRLVSLLMVVLLLTFSAVYKIMDSSGSLAFWPELLLAATALCGIATSYRSERIRRHFNVALRVLCYLTAIWFITLSVLNEFLPNYAVGLLFILPGLGVGYSVTLRTIGPLVKFFGVTVSWASIACVLYAGPGIAPAFFVSSLICISLVTLFVAAARLDAEKQFHASEERYHAVVQQASDGIYLLDAETLTFLYANPAFCRMIGRTLSELKGKTMANLLVSHPHFAAESPGQSFRAGHAQVDERVLRRADGTVFFAELRMNRIRYTDRDVLSVVVHDISSRKEYEKRLVAAKENAEEIARFKSTLLANMSHEIRTPLSSILGWTSVLNDEVPEDQREVVKLIEVSGRRLHRTLDSVLELALLEANTRRVQPHLIDVKEELHAVVSSMQMQAEKKGLNVIVDDRCPDALSRLDASCLRRVLRHLLDNAIKFTDAGEISVVVDRHASDIRIKIRDTGVGVSDDFMPSIFEEFKQESHGLDRNHEGSGLGLAIVKRLVDLMGCRISVESRRGDGSTFSIILPSETVANRQVKVA